MSVGDIVTLKNMWKGKKGIITNITNDLYTICIFLGESEVIYALANKNDIYGN